MIIACHHISKEFIENTVLSDITFHLEKGDRAAIVGINGCGKTTLIRIIMSEEPADSGQVVIAKDTTVGYLSQHADISFDNTIYAEMLATKQPVIDMEESLREMERRMDEASGDDLEQLIIRNIMLPLRLAHIQKIRDLAVSAVPFPRRRHNHVFPVGSA